MNKYDDAVAICGEDLVDSWAFSSGSSRVPDVFILDANVSGSPFDSYRYPVLEQEVIEDLWKCNACGKVYKLSETLECEACGTSVTERSRFVLE